jgi:squalene-associated FAD-dependent desaturase
VVKSAGLNSLKSLVTLQKDIPLLLANEDITVLEWLLDTKQPERLIEQLWQPLCLATLNTQCHRASAHVLAVVLRDSLGQDEPMADLLIPTQPLGTLFPQAAVDFIQRKGGKSSKQTRIAEIVIEEGQISGAITTSGQFIDSENIILATGPDQTAQLLTAHMRFPRPSQTPITTVYLQYPEHCRLPKPLLGMTGTMSHWLFDRSQQHPGMIAVVISSDGPHENMSKEALVQHVCAEVHQLLPDFPDKANEGFVIREKRATFECTVKNHRSRPKCQTAIPGLWLTGDYIANDYPATLEGAIRNGEHCADLLLSSLTSSGI